MKEIKFRGWDIENKRMVFWDELMKNKDLLWSFFGNEFYALNPPKYLWERMQFTGLLDKNGKEIFEGDIVRYVFTDLDNSKSFYIQKVEYTLEHFTEGDYGYTLGIGFNISWDTEEEAEVIGNIYESKHLLENFG